MLRVAARRWPLLSISKLVPAGGREVAPATPASFDALGLTPQLSRAVAERFTADAPTPIQRLAMPALLEGHSAVLAAPTGSGKTLAYALPIAQRLRAEEEAVEGRMAFERVAGRPRALVRGGSGAAGC